MTLCPNAPRGTEVYQFSEKLLCEIKSYHENTEAIDIFIFIFIFIFIKKYVAYSLNNVINVIFAIELCWLFVFMRHIAS